MSESSRRAVLLARPGAACERLRSALSDAGAELVLEADPTTLDPSALGLAAPQVIVVALDAATEDAIERFDPVLGDPAVEVIYEEAALAASREGWDLARWTRHLAAKLQGHGNVLPPGHEPEGDGEEFGAGTAVPGAATAIAEAPLALAPEPVAPEPVAAVPEPETAPAPVAVETMHLSPFDPVAAELHFEAPMAVTATPALLDEQALDAIDMPLLDEPGMVSTDDDALVIEPFESSFDYEISPAQAPVAVELLDDLQLLDTEQPVAMPQHATPAEPVLLFEASRSLDIASDDSAPVATPAAPATAAPSAPDWSFADENSGTAASTESRAANNRFQRDLGDLETRISALELVEDRTTVHSNGAVLVLAGIGGPDAVRQLLGALPDTFPRPVLVQQRLDGGRYDRLVAQMQRATPLQVRLAEPGLLAMAGSIYILPAEIGISVNEHGIRFTEGEGDVIASLPSADSAVLLLSGSDPARVDAAMNHSWAGALVAGQATDGCYDAAASTALIARGGVAGQPVELAERLIARWR